MQAAYYGRAASVAALLGAGVDPDALNNAGQTPLYYAEENGHEDCLCLLRGEAPPTPRRSVPDFDDVAGHPLVCRFVLFFGKMVSTS